MTLVALLLLYPTSLLHPSELDCPLSGHRAAIPALAQLIEHQGPDRLSGDSAREAECTGGESTDDEGAIPLLGCRSLPRLRGQDDRPSHLRSMLGIFLSSFRSPLLRC
jgi:hypothetical protein